MLLDSTRERFSTLRPHTINLFLPPSFSLLYEISLDFNVTIEVKTNFSENSFAYLRRTRRDRILFFFSAERRKERRDKRRWNNTIYGARADVRLPLGVADHSANPSLNQRPPSSGPSPSNPYLHPRFKDNKCRTFRPRLRRAIRFARQSKQPALESPRFGSR